jgi:hypothetical protein
MAKEALWKPQIDEMETIEELRGVKDYINHKLKFMMRKDTAEGIIKRKEEELQELKERFANGGDIRIEVKDYNEGRSLSREQVENILKDINKKDKH